MMEQHEQYDKASSLLYLVEKKQKEFLKYGWKQSIKDSFSQLYIPSLKSFIIIFFTLFIIFIITHFIPQISTIIECIIQKVGLGNYKFTIELPYLDQEKNHYQNLIAIMAGIGTIIFALIIFIAESMRDDEDKNRARVLLKESFLYPLTVSVILILLLFIWGEKNYWIFVPIITVALLVIYSLHRTISVLLNRNKFMRKKIELFKERIQQSIDLEIKERLGNNMLFERLDGKNIRMKFSFFGIDKPSRFYEFYTEKRGIITDINLSRLMEFADLIDKHGREKGFVFFDNEKQKADDQRPKMSDSSAIADSPILKSLVNAERYILKKLHDPVNEKTNLLFAINKQLIGDDKNILKKLGDLTEKIFDIKQSESFSDEIRAELSGVKDQFIGAISNHQLGKTEELQKFYVAIAEGFLTRMKMYGAIYTANLARKERQSIGGGWEFPGWLSSDIRDLLEIAVNSHDKEIIHHISYLPIAVMIRAIEFKDHYLFQEFIQFSNFIYFLSSSQNSDLKKVILDRYFLNIKSVITYYLKSAIRREEQTKDELITIKDFAVYFLIMFQELLKSAYGKKDFQNFKMFLNIVIEMFEDFEAQSAAHSVSFLKRTYELNKTEENRRLLERQEILEQIEQEINQRKFEMIFGLSSWIFAELCAAQKDDPVHKLYEAIETTLPDSLEKLTKIFLDVHQYESEDLWGRGFWDIIPDGKVYTRDPFKNIETFYVIKSLCLLARESEGAIGQIELPTSRDFASMTDETGSLMKFLNSISMEPKRWQFILTDKAIAQIESFKKLLLNARHRQIEAETEIIRGAKISNKKVIAFKKEMISSFDESAVMRDIFKHYKLYNENLKEIVNKKDRFGISTLDEKSAFFDEWHVHYLDWGSGYGRSLASGEDNFLIEEILKNAKPTEWADFEKTLYNYSDLSQIFLIVINIDPYSLFKSTKNFRPKWVEGSRQLNVHGFEGWLLFNDVEIPIFELYRGGEKKILIVNKSKFGELCQYSPLNIGEDDAYIDDVFYINIQPFSENLALINQYIKKPPKWLVERGDQESQNKYLREHVLVDIYERFEFNPLKDFDCHVTILKNPPE